MHVCVCVLRGAQCRMEEPCIEAVFPECGRNDINNSNSCSNSVLLHSINDSNGETASQGCAHSQYALCTRTVRTAHASCAHCAHKQCVVRTPAVHTAYTHSTHCIHQQYTLRTPAVRTAVHTSRKRIHAHCRIIIIHHEMRVSIPETVA